MSSILRALRKIEKDTSGVKPWAPHIRPRSLLNRRWATIRLLSILVSAGLLGGTAVIVAYRIPPDIMSFFKSKSIDNNPAHSNPAPPRPNRKQAPEPSAGIGVRQEPTAPEKTTDPTRTKKMTKQRGDKVPLSSTSSPGKILKTEPAFNIRERTKPHSLDKPIGSAPEPAVATGANTDLALQAIAWSSDPGKRIAVINGQILKEGEILDGHLVRKITEDTVLIRKGLKMISLSFPAR